MNNMKFLIFYNSVFHFERMQTASCVGFLPQAFCCTMILERKKEEIRPHPQSG